MERIFNNTSSNFTAEVAIYHLYYDLHAQSQLDAIAIDIQVIWKKVGKSSVTNLIWHKIEFTLLVQKTVPNVGEDMGLRDRRQPFNAVYGRVFTALDALDGCLRTVDRQIGVSTSPHSDGRSPLAPSNRQVRLRCAALLFGLARLSCCFLGS